MNITLYQLERDLAHNQAYWRRIIKERYFVSEADSYSKAYAKSYAKIHARDYAKAHAKDSPKAYGKAYAKIYAEVYSKTYAEAYPKAYAKARAKGYPGGDPFSVSPYIVEEYLMKTVRRLDDLGVSFEVIMSATELTREQLELILMELENHVR
jgi:hypothetical protein